MVDANLIVLDGIGLYIVLAIILFMVAAISILAWSGIRQDEKMEMLNAEITNLKLSNANLHGENWRYRLKYGVLDVETKEKPQDVGNKM